MTKTNFYMIPPTLIEIRQPMSESNLHKLKKGTQKEAKLPISSKIIRLFSKK